MDGGLKSAASFFIISKHVKAGAGRRQQDDIAGFSPGCRRANSLGAGIYATFETFRAAPAIPPIPNGPRGAILLEDCVVDNNIASAARKIQELQDRITAIIRSSELEMSAFVSNLEKLKDVEDDSSEEKKTIVKEFWARAEQTDFKVSI